MRVRYLVGLMLLGCACRRDQPALHTKAAPITAKHLSAVAKPLAIELRGPADDLVVRALTAQLERYRAAQPHVSYVRVDGPLGVTLTHGAHTVDVAGLRNGAPARASLLVARALRDLVDREQGVAHRIGFLSGEKGREPGYEDLAAYFAKAQPAYVLERVDARQNDLDDALEALIVTAPRAAISPEELRRVDKFLMHGKAVAIFGNNLELHEHDPSMFVRTTSGLIPLLAGYGLSFDSLLTIDKHQFWQPFHGGIRLDPYPAAFVAPAAPAPTFDEAFPAFLGAPQLVLAFPTEITIDVKRAERHGAKVRRVAWTTRDIVKVLGATSSLHPSRERMGEGATGQFNETREATLAVAFTGEVASAFDAGHADARLLVVSSASFVANPFLEAGTSPFGGMMPGLDPKLGADEELLRYAEIYEPLRPAAMLVAKQSCDWLLRTDEWVDP